MPALLSKLGGSDDAALEGLKQVLKAQPKILASVLPKLAAPPIDARRAETLAALAEVAGAALPPHLEALFPPLLAAMASEAEAEAEAAKSAASAVLRAVPSDAHYLLLPQVLGGARDERPRVRAAASALCGAYVSEARCFDEEDDVPRLIETLVSLFCDADEGVVLAAWTALGAVTGAVAKERQALYLRDVRAAVQGAREKIRRRLRDAGARPSPLLVPGLCLPKGLAPVAQVYLQGVLAGRNADARESAAEGLREATLSTTAAAVKPHVIPITGPLIRVLGDKHPGSVKSAVLGALAAMIDVGGAALKPFVPQLQTTFAGACSTRRAGPTESRGGAGQAGRAPAARRRARRRPNRVLETAGEGGGEDDERGARQATLRAAGALAHAGANVKPPTVAAARDAAPGSAATPRTTRRARRRRSRSRTPPPGSRRRRAPTWPSSWARRRAATPTRASTARRAERAGARVPRDGPGVARLLGAQRARQARTRPRASARASPPCLAWGDARASAEQNGGGVSFFGKGGSRAARALRDDGARARAPRRRRLCPGSAPPRRTRSRRTWARSCPRSRTSPPRTNPKTRASTPTAPTRRAARARRGGRARLAQERLRAGGAAHARARGRQTWFCGA